MENNSPDSTHIQDNITVINDTHLYNNQLKKNLSYKQKIQLTRFLFSIILMALIGLCLFLVTQESSSTKEFIVTKIYYKYFFVLFLLINLLISLFIIYTAIFAFIVEYGL